MPSNPPTVADLEAEVAGQCAIALAEAGVYLRAVDSGGLPITPAIRQGLRKGAKCVGLYLANPLVLADAEVAVLSPFAIERVLAEGMLFGLRQALLHWHRAVQKYEEPLAATPMTGGWLNEEKRAIKDRVSELHQMCSEPYREPTEPIVVSNAHPFGFTPWRWGIVQTPPDPAYPTPGPDGYPLGYGTDPGWGWAGWGPGWGDYGSDNW